VAVVWWCGWCGGHLRGQGGSLGSCSLCCQFFQGGGATNMGNVKGALFSLEACGTRFAITMARLGMLPRQLRIRPVSHTHTPRKDGISNDLRNAGTP
jgi:hypothetical protein